MPLLVALVFLAGCSRCGPFRLRGSLPLTPSGPGPAWVVQTEFLTDHPQNDEPDEVTMLPAGWGDRVEVLSVQGPDAHVAMAGGRKGYIRRGALIDATGVVEAATFCQGTDDCQQLVLVYARDLDVSVLTPPWGQELRMSTRDLRFDEKALAAARENTQLDLRRRILEKAEQLTRAKAERTRQEAAKAPAEPAATTSAVATPVGPAGAGADAPDGDGGEVDAADEADPAEVACTETGFEDASQPAKRAEVGPLGIIVFDPEMGNPPPGYDWKALTVSHLAGYKVGEPLSPELRTRAAKARRAQPDEWGEGVTLAFDVPENVVRGHYHELAPEGFRALPPSSLQGALKLQIDDRGCEIGRRFYTGVVDTGGCLFPAPVAWTPRPVSWKDEHPVELGAEGVRLDGNQLVLAVKGSRVARSGPLSGDCLDQGETLTGARIATIEPAGARILVAKYGDRCYWVFHVKGEALEEIGAVIRGDL